MNQKISGFTLLELLLVVIALGVLAVLAFPTFLSSINQAKGTEALSTLSMALQSQQTHHYETGYFATNWAELNVQPNNTESNYSYTTETTEKRQTAILKAAPKSNELKGYLAGIEAVVQKGEKVFPRVICEVKKPGVKALSAAVVEFKKRRVVCGQRLKRVK